MCQIFIKLQSYEKTFEMNVFLIVYLVYVALTPPLFLTPRIRGGRKRQEHCDAPALWVF